MTLLLILATTAGFATQMDPNSSGPFTLADEGLIRPDLAIAQVGEPNVVDNEQSHRLDFLSAKDRTVQTETQLQRREQRRPRSNKSAHV